MSKAQISCTLNSSVANIVKLENKILSHYILCEPISSRQHVTTSNPMVQDFPQYSTAEIRFILNILR